MGQKDIALGQYGPVLKAQRKLLHEALRYVDNLIVLLDFMTHQIEYSDKCAQFYIDKE